MLTSYKSNVIIQAKQSGGTGMKYKISVLVMVMCFIFCVLMAGCAGKDEVNTFTKWDEDFTFHDGVRFGDEIEKENEYFLSEGEIIAGIPNSVIDVEGDSFGCVAGVMYLFRIRGSSLTTSDILNDGALISEALNTKYGEPYFVFDGDIFPPEIASSFYYVYDNSDKFYTPSKKAIPVVYEMWILDIGNENCVVIEHAVYDSSHGFFQNIHYASYRLLEREFVEDKINGRNEVVDTELQQMIEEL